MGLGLNLCGGHDIDALPELQMRRQNAMSMKAKCEAQVASLKQGARPVFFARQNEDALTFDLQAIIVYRTCSVAAVG